MLVKTQRTHKREVTELLQTNRQTQEEDDLNFAQVYKAAGGSIARARGDD